MNKGTTVIGFLLSFMAGGMLMRGIDRSGGYQGSADISAAFDDSGKVWSDDDANPPVSSNDPMWGKRDAPVTIVVFSDFQCPFCSKVEATLTQVKEKYGPAKVRFIWKNNPLPFHKDARPAALAAETVFRLGGSKAFWKFHDTAFANQKSLTPDNLEAWATQAGVDAAKFKAAMEKQEYAAKLDADTATGKAAGVSGTPASFINGVFLSGAQPLEKFTQVIDEQLKAAENAKAIGTKGDKLYAKLSGEGKAKNAQPDNKRGRDEAGPGQDDKTVWKVPVHPNNPVRGSATAPVTIVQWSDFQCPFCGKVEPTIDELVKSYGDKIRIVWKNNPLPFHPRAEPAAELAMEAKAERGDKGFWAAHDLLFKNQAKLADDDLLGYAKQLELDVDKVKTAMVEKRYTKDFTVDQDLADDVQASGTPHFFINGRRLSGAQPIEKFKALIDEEMKKAEALLAKGVAAKDLYAEIIKDGKEPPPPEKKTVDPPQADSPWRGNDKAKIVIQIFSDFQCPFCKKVEDTVAQVEKAYGDKVKVVWRHKPLPMHKDAPLAAEASQEIWKQKGKDGFWKYHDTLFKNQQALSRTDLEKYAEELGGVDMGKFKKALDSNEHKKFVDSEAAIGEKADIKATPAVVINGYFFSGAQPFSKFKKTIELAMKDAGMSDKPSLDKPPSLEKAADKKPEKKKAAQ